MGGTISIIISISLFVAGLTLTILDKIYFPILLSGLLLIIIMIYVYFIDKRMLSKVIYSDQGIEWKWLKKRISYIKWDEIDEVKSIPHGRTVYNLSFVANKNHIDVGLTKKMYDVIMLICPEPNIKFQIKNLKEFEHLHKSDLY